VRNRKPCPFCGGRTLRCNLLDEYVDIGNNTRVLVEFSYYSRKCSDCFKFILTPKEYSDIIRIIRRQEI